MNRFWILLAIGWVMLFTLMSPCASAEELLQVIPRDAGEERLVVRYPGPVWDSGQTIDFSIRLTRPRGASSADQPTWRVWASEIGTSDWRELAWASGKLRIPEDMAGLYQLKVSPEVAGDQSDAPSDYVVRELIAVRRQLTRGTINLTTPDNRVYFARGESIPIHVVFKCAPADQPRSLTIRLVDSLAVLGEEVIDTSKPGPASFTIPEGWTLRLRPGRYVLTTTSAALTVFHQTLVIGAGRIDDIRPSVAPRLIVARCDALAPSVSTEDLYSATDRADTFFDMSRTLGINLYAPDLSALGLNTDQAHFEVGAKAMEAINRDPRGFSPEEAMVLHPALLHQNEASTEGMRFVPILALPGTGTPPTGIDLSRAVEDALIKGTWSPLLDQAAANLAGSDAESDQRSRDSLPPSLSPYLGDSLNSRPELGLFPWSGVTLHTVMKGVSSNNLMPPWLEIETPLEGDGFIGSVASMLMRGPKPGATGMGVGFDIPAHSPDLTTQRALGAILKPYGPFLSSLNIDKRVALINSSRMTLLDRIAARGGVHSQRLYEAFYSLQFAQLPPTLVDSREINPDSLTGFKAIVLVDQRVDMEPGLAEALRNAQARGVAVFFDGTCRGPMAPGMRPLGVAFNHLDRQAVSLWAGRQNNEASPNDRANSYALLNNRAPIAVAMGRSVRPTVTVDSPEIWVGQWQLGQGRLVMLVNNSLCPLPDAQLGHVGLFRNIRMPIRAAVKLDTPMRVVYDVMAMRKAEVDETGQWIADFRSMPVRLFAVLPEEIYAITLAGPRIVTAGMPFRWNMVLRDRDIQPIAAGVPIRLCLRDDAGNTIDERFLTAQPTGTGGVLTTPVNVRADSLILEATELFSGRSARVRFTVQQVDQPIPLTRKTPSDDVAMIPSLSDKGTKDTGVFPACEASFGPGVGSMALLDHERLAVVGAGKWGANLYGIDASNGRVRWSKRVGHFDVDEVQRVGDGVGGIGLDFSTPELSHFYIGSRRGEFVRRFVGRPDHASFAAWPDASWVASATTAAVTAWSIEGVQLWSTARTAEAPPVTLHALDGSTLLCVDSGGAWAVDALSGKIRWRVSFDSAVPDHPKIKSSRDGKTMAITAGSDRPRVILIREGVMLTPLMTAADDLDVSPDGLLVAIAAGYQLKFYSTTSGLKWVFHTDAPASSPQFSPDSSRLFVASALGTMNVLDSKGKLLWERDMTAKAVARWMSNGNLLLGTANGWVSLLDAGYREIWSARLVPPADEPRTPQFPAIGIATVRTNP